MELERLWAGVAFAAQNGDTGGLLTAAARSGIHLSCVIPCPGGFRARCAARQYFALSALARHRRVRLRVQKRMGLYFKIRPLLRRAGLWIGIGVFVPLLLWSQGMIWAVDAPNLTRGQQARAVLLLDQAGLSPGCFVSEEKLAAGEYALVQSGEFSWASLNFLKGRLVVETAAAKAVPEIAAGTLRGIRSRVAATVVSTNLVSGTMLVSPGDAVEAGQGLIGTARAERDGTLIFEPAAGTVRGEFHWTFAQELPLKREVLQMDGRRAAAYRLTFAGRQWALPSFFAFHREDGVSVTRHWQPEFLGLRLPFWVQETDWYGQRTALVESTEAQAVARARLSGRQALNGDYPDAAVTALSEEYSSVGGTLRYRADYTVVADLCE